jgi:hypothetical protein
MQQHPDQACFTEGDHSPELPAAIWVLIIGHLSLPSACRAACACRTLHQAVTDVVSQVQEIQLQTPLLSPQAAQSPQNDQHHHQQQHPQQQKQSIVQGNDDAVQGVPLLRECSHHPLLSFSSAPHPSAPESQCQHTHPVSTSKAPLVIRIPGHKGPALLSYMAIRSTGVRSLDLKGTARWVSDDWLRSLAGAWANTDHLPTINPTHAASTDISGHACSSDRASGGLEQHYSRGCVHDQARSSQGRPTEGNTNSAHCQAGASEEYSQGNNGHGQAGDRDGHSSFTAAGKQHEALHEPGAASSAAGAPQEDGEAGMQLQGLSLQESKQAMVDDNTAASGIYAQRAAPGSPHAQNAASGFRAQQLPAITAPFCRGWQGQQLTSLDLGGSGRLTEAGLQALCSVPSIQVG